MRFLVVGAGALGGYFGGRLLQAGQDVTFLLRPRRAAQLAANGLCIKSPAGNAHLPSPPHVLSDDIAEPFDVVIVACKAYDLAHTIDSFAAAVGPNTAVLPLLNGLQHLDVLSERFGRERVLGGLCLISAALDEAGNVLHLNDMHGLTFGELGGGRSARVDAIAAAFDPANFTSTASDNIMQAMWEKWVFISSMAGITTLMRSSIGDIDSAGAADLGLALFEECRAIAAHNGFAPSAAAVERGRAMVSAAGSPITASMLKDIERGAPTEADHILGDLLGRGVPGESDRSMLRIAYAHLKTYEARRSREEAARQA
ncbi:2-dehydropantoate 2-reductase [Variovorax robiniae]|uniref:2-dehydropantoate 2-reductase n=1 Tax=Variovorax robiniae TaxID=1836199 RepID=A0ABU8WZP6_9BURK